MGLFEQLPYTNFHDLNLTELVKWVKALSDEIHDFEVVNQISYGGQWDITKAYQRYTIVTVNGTDGYISLKPVPIGVNYTNTEYWGIVADFTTALAGIGSRVADLENDNVTNKANIATLQDDVNRAMTASQNLNMVILGDSYGYCNYLTGVPYPAECYMMKVKDYLNLDNNHYHYLGLNGARMSAGSTSMLNVLQSLPTFANESSVNLVVTQSGINDWNNLSDIVDGIKDYADAVKARFPNAKLIHFLTMGSFQNGDMGTASDINTFFGILHDIRDRYIRGCTQNNIMLIDDTVIPMIFKANYYTDLYHPNANGHTALAYIMANRINGSDVMPIDNMFTTTQSKLTITNTNCDLAEIFTGQIWIKDRKTISYSGYGVKEIHFTTAPTINTNGATWVDIGILNKDVYINPTLVTWSSQWSFHGCYRKSGEGTYNNCTINIRISAGKVQMALLDCYSGGWQNASVADIYFNDKYLEFNALPA